MIINIDENSGFCWGVVRTVEIAEKTLSENHDGNVYILGEIIHNPKEVERLERMGLKTINHEHLADLKGENVKVLIRAHGEPPSTYQKAKELGIELIDATCPLVTALQNRVKRFYDEGYQIVILGKPHHPEIIGLRGVCNDECVVIQSEEEALEKVDFTRKTIFLSQTTMSKEKFHLIRQLLESKVKEIHSFENYKEQLVVKDTLCRAVIGREDNLRKFAQENDVVIFVAGRNSSNGKNLFGICCQANPNSYFIEEIAELKPEWFRGVQKVGITGATSTPRWYMEEVKKAIEQFASN
ncbi:4-hydroxy-3-methylbut-2-enyl diphosphate reductase [Bacteroidetes/Chlorobi group bacterium MS-B_bin-24]|jgi:4-hydroxy-3-methylbut-2-enyl diphosphate reductase|nr:MAG: 4-hydroxy-3-methylbut-2-enyl diphosphate reductase [Bacteroidetes/Chlorobi group bacterium MS-B_bin-24]